MTSHCILCGAGLGCFQFARKCLGAASKKDVVKLLACIKICTQTDSHYIRYTAASVLKSTTVSTPEGYWLMFTL